jgi:hypothetical protein
MKLAVYFSMGLVNPILLYLYTKSFNDPIRALGILKCYPIINIIIYKKLIGKLKRKGYSNDRIIKLYLKGILTLNLIRENQS